MPFRKEIKLRSDFSRITISLASPESILERSHGEITKPETINYRTYKPEKDGLFCERIFGPVRDFECHCGKYKRIRYKGIVCDRCGVEVTEKKVRRERMGHIALVVPVAHIWYFRSLPSKIGNLLGLSGKKLEYIIYYERYAVINPGVKQKDGINYMDFLTEEEYLKVMEDLPKENQQLPDDNPEKFIAKMGGEALEMLLARLNLDELSVALREQANTETSQQRKADALKRLKMVEAFRSANKNIDNHPEWMVVKVVPVIPPELRPLVPLEGGRFATSDLNDLYRRVIIRNNRLKRLMEIKAPEIILRNEKRMLQEAVDALFDNSRRVNAVKTDSNRALKSLSDMLKGKQGRFRQNLLGKRVDYSGRSVIVAGPELKLHECGLPKDMAAELFKPFIIRKLIERGIVKTVKSAKKVVDKKDPVVMDILENVINGHPILLNRAPTLHRMGIQAFQPKLIEGKAIQIHPLVCTAFNADFDGDQMAVHIPLSYEACLEAQILMLASHNILHPASGSPVTVPSQDMVLGLYYMTKEGVKEKGEGITFYGPEEVIIAHNERKISLHAKIKVRVSVWDDEKNKLVQKIIPTTAGRVLFNEVVPKEIGFLNALLTKSKIRDIISMVVKKTNFAIAAKFLDDIKSLGYRHAFRGGLSFNLEDVIVPDEKLKLIDTAEKQIAEIKQNYNMGFITENERYNQVIDVWTRINSRVTDNLLSRLSSDKHGFNSVYMMLDSGARGSKEQIRQLGGMRGLMAKPQKSMSGSAGEIIENPIISNFKEGLSVLEYFISTHGARKGLADTALKTADAGYLTRRLVDVSQDVIISEDDCGTLRGIEITALKDNEEIVEPLSERILGRVSLHDVHDPLTGKLLVASGEEITEEVAETIENTILEKVDIRSVLTCESKRGVCAKCYGRNLANGKMIQIGEAVGIIAAQSIGEPGTQLTLRTFHVGGTASRIASESQIKAKFEGKIEFEGLKTVKLKVKGADKARTTVLSRRGELRIIDTSSKKVLMSNLVPYGSVLFVNEGDKVEKGADICNWDPYNAVILSETDGKVKFENVEEGYTFREESDEQTGHKEKVIIESRDKTKNPSILIYDGKAVRKSYNLPVGSHLMVEDSEGVKAGQTLVKIPRAITKTRDITGGLPRVTELFEARSPSNPAEVTEIDGTVMLGEVKRGSREIIVTPKEGGEAPKYMVPLTRHILVQDNDYVLAGMPLSDGVISPNDILSIKGPHAVQEYLVNEIQEVYRLQGVKINDKHIEIIVRQMMQKMRVIDPGDTRFLEGELVDRQEFYEENDWIYDKKIVTDAGDTVNFKTGRVISLRKLRDENSSLKRKDKKLVQVRDAVPATSAPVLLGITQAALGTRSFISAASFQETTKVLSEASVNGKVDLMMGLKENVIVGHLIPAGTGLRPYRDLIVGSKEEYEALMSAKKEKESTERERELVEE